MPIQSYDIAQQLNIGPQLLTDGSRSAPRGGRMGETIVSEIWGKYGELCSRGYVYAARTAAAASVPIDTTSTNTPSLWNRASSGKWVIPLKIYLSLGAVGTPILQGFTLSFLNGVGDAIATAAPIVTWTNVAPKNMLIGGAAASAYFAPAVSTYTVNPSPLCDLGFGHLLEGTAASGQLYSQFGIDFDSMLIMPPSTSIHFGSTIATSTTYWTTIIFAEIPKVA